MEETKSEKKRLSWYQWFLQFAAGYLVVLLLLFIAVKTVLAPFSVQGSSMNPTLYDGEKVFVNKLIRTYEPNDIIVFDPGSQVDSDSFVKRVVAVGGDRVAIIDGDLYVNGQLIESDFEKMESSGKIIDEITLAENEYFVLGDNRNRSNDSRLLGPIPSERIVGKVIVFLDKRKFGFGGEK